MTCIWQQVSGSHLQGVEIELLYGSVDWKPFGKDELGMDPIHLVICSLIAHRNTSSVNFVYLKERLWRGLLG